MSYCEITRLEEEFIVDLIPIVIEETENFSERHGNADSPQQWNTDQKSDFVRKINSLIEILEPCEKFLQNYPRWAKQREETIGALRNLEKHLKDLETKCNPALKLLGNLQNFLSLTEMGDKVFSDIKISWKYLLGGLVLSMLVSLIWIVLMRWLAGIMIWLSIILVLGFLVFGTKADYIFSNFLPKLLKPSYTFTETKKKALLDLKSKVEENRSKALVMCALDFNLLHELGACEFYDQLIVSINDLFGDNIFHEILDGLLKFLKTLPEEIDYVEDIQTSVRTCVESILPKTRNLLRTETLISCIILCLFLAVFMSRRQSCTILIQGLNLGMLNSTEAEVAKLIAAARVKGSKLEKMISSAIKKKSTFNTVDNGAIILELATIYLNSIDVNDGFLSPETKLVIEITNKLEKDLNSYKICYEMFEKCSKERLTIQDIRNWTTIIIYHVPEGTGETAINNAVKHFLRVKARDCIDLKRLPTNGNNWLVKVPTCYSRALLKEKFLNIAEENCIIMPR